MTRGRPAKVATTAKVIAKSPEPDEIIEDEDFTVEVSEEEVAAEEAFAKAATEAEAQTEAEAEAEAQTEDEAEAEAEENEDEDPYGFNDGDDEDSVVSDSEELSTKVVGNLVSIEYKGMKESARPEGTISVIVPDDGIDAGDTAALITSGTSYRLHLGVPQFVTPEHADWLSQHPHYTIEKA